MWLINEARVFNLESFLCKSSFGVGVHNFTLEAVSGKRIKPQEEHDFPSRTETPVTQPPHWFFFFLKKLFSNNFPPRNEGGKHIYSPVFSLSSVWILQQIKRQKRFSCSDTTTMWKKKERQFVTGAARLSALQQRSHGAVGFCTDAEKAAGGLHCRGRSWSSPNGRKWFGSDRDGSKIQWSMCFHTSLLKHLLYNLLTPLASQLLHSPPEGEACHVFNYTFCFNHHYYLCFYLTVQLLWYVGNAN